MNRALRLFAFISLVACLGPLGLPSPVDAQQPVSPRRIGVLLAAFSPESKEAQAFRQGLRDAGYLEGRDVVIEWRSADGDYARLPALAADLVQRKVDVIFADTTLATRAVKHATSTIPVVFALPADPVGSGLVASLAHPGGHVTGLSTILTDLAAKQLQLLKEVIPRLSRVAVLWDPDQLWHAKAIEELKAVAPSLSIQLSIVGARTPVEFGPAFPAVSRAQATALYLPDSPLFVANRTTLLKLASKSRLPAIFSERKWVDEGGLMSYGANYVDQLRRAAGYVDKILKGAKPGDLPIEEPTRLELVVNLKTAKALGLTIPESILLRADEVIR
jgi:putative tryptophan/tyrosine transport system substrate-binding protein